MFDRGSSTDYDTFTYRPFLVCGIGPCTTARPTSNARLTSALSGGLAILNSPVIVETPSSHSPLGPEIVWDESKSSPSKVQA